nr:MAG: aminotransferase class I/II-fold pyridoxal phosphate-dependent enzyme [Hyphomicrobiales bacterium]
MTDKLLLQANFDSLTPQQKREFARELLRNRSQNEAAPDESKTRVIEEGFYNFARDPNILALRAQHADLAADGKRTNPYFQVNESIARGTTTIGGRQYVNFANYNYLGLSGEPAVSQAAKDAVDRYGTSVSASRIASGERPVQGELEREIARMMDVDSCVVFVGGHATNVSTIGHLFGRNDVIYYDELAHNSAIQGALLSGARRIRFPHNDWQALDRLLEDRRKNYDRALIFIEGVYSMDGDFPDIPRFVELRNKHKTYLMIDEAHSLGILGKNGGGVREHFGLSGNDADLWMGTLSKTLASCGGYIAGCGELVEYLKYSAPGFLYSVGIPSSGAAAALAALRIMQAEPERVATLRARAKLFLELAHQNGLNTGNALETAIVPIIIGDSKKCIDLSNALFNRGINVQPVLYPVVSENASRLRFFLTSIHTEEQIRETVAAVAQELQRLLSVTQ